MKNDTIFVCMGNGDHHGDGKCRKEASHFIKFKYSTDSIRHRQERFSPEERRADLQKIALDFLIFSRIKVVRAW